MSTRSAFSFLMAALVATGAGCTQKKLAAPPAGAVVAAARASLAPFKGSLKEALTSALAVSPESAIEVCAAKAPELARAASHDGVVVGRSAIKLRSGANAPPAWLQPVMTELATAPGGSDVSRVVPLGAGRHGYAEAIWIAPPCLACHGETVAPSVESKLKERYPDDRARSFKAGDFRGVFWAELDDAAIARAPSR